MVNLTVNLKKIIILKNKVDNYLEYKKLDNNFFTYIAPKEVEKYYLIINKILVSNSSIYSILKDFNKVLDIIDKFIFNESTEFDIYVSYKDYGSFSPYTDFYQFLGSNNLTLDDFNSFNDFNNF